MDAPPRNRWGFAALGALAVLLGLWGVFGHKKKDKAPKAQVASVLTAKAEYRDVPVAITALGSVQAWQSNLIRAQVNGRLLRFAVAEGSYVRAGQLLAEIDPAPYRALLTQAEGALKRDRAQLQNARLDLERYQRLAASESIARQQLDTQAALVQQQEGVVQIDEGAAAAARINLGYCRILAPVSGRVGVRLTDPGNLVSANDANGIVIVNQITPIAVTFSAPQGEFQRLATLSDGFRRPLATDALSQETGAVLGSGQLTVADNRVDPATGTVLLKARFGNDSRRLWPGQFVNVRLTLQTLSHALVVPAAAVNQGPKGPFAYVVGPGRTALVRPLTIDLTQDGLAVVKTGLNPGDTVVTEGQMALKAGMALDVRSPAPGGRQGS